MTLVVPRMIGAVAGFISKHGTWPTKLVVPAENWSAYRDDPAPVLQSYDSPTTQAVFARLELVPVPEQLYVAVDAEGRWFRYGVEEGPEGNWWDVVSTSMQTEAPHEPRDGSADGGGDVLLTKPIENAYVIPGTRVAAGEYPGSPPSAPPDEAERKLAAFLHAGIDAFIDLTDPGEPLAPYAPMLCALAARSSMNVSHERLTIRDNDVCEPAHMLRVLDAIDARLAEGHGVYVHCWGGIGRTGMVVGCWLVRHGRSGEEALRQVDALFRSMSPAKVRRHASWGSPQTPAQRAMVQSWAGHDRPASLAPMTRATARPQDGAEQSPPASARHQDGSQRCAVHEAFAEWCDRRDVQPVAHGDARVRFDVEWDDAQWLCALWLHEQARQFALYVYPVEPLPHAYPAAMLEAVARANCALILGNFEYDVRDGELRFKSSARFAEDGMSPLEIDQLVSVGVTTMAQYWPALQDVARGAEAATAIACIEELADGVKDDADDDTNAKPADDIGLDALLAELEAETQGSAERVEAPAWELLVPRPDVTPDLRDRMRGALTGLAVGDAIGTTVEFRSPGSFPPVTDMVGGGPFHLKPGQWTDDTSMALCLAESLIERRAFDPRDQMERYVRWRTEGHLSSTGRCFDIGNTVGAALRAFEKTGQSFAGPTGERTAGNGSLMRLAPVPLFYFGRDEDAIALAGASSRTTHGAPVAIHACRYLAALITGAIAGATKEALLSPSFAPRPGYWDAQPLHAVIAAIADGSFKTKQPPEIRGSGYAAHALEAALWAFHHGGDFREGCLLAVNLGDDADTTAAIYGQLAGAHYGESGIPAEWRAKLALKPLVDRYAELLFQLAFGGPPAMGQRNARAAAEARRMVVAADGDPAAAIRQFLDQDERAKQDMGVLAYHMSGSMSAHAGRDEVLLHLRVALGLSLSASWGV